MLIANSDSAMTYKQNTLLPVVESWTRAIAKIWYNLIKTPKATRNGTKFDFLAKLEKRDELSIRLIISMSLISFFRALVVGDWSNTIRDTISKQHTFLSRYYLHDLHAILLFQKV